MHNGYTALPGQTRFIMHPGSQAEPQSCQTGPTDAEQQHTVSHHSLGTARGVCAASNLSDHLSRLLLFTWKASGSNLSSAVNQPLTVSSGWVKLPLLREEAFFLLCPPHDIMSHGGNSVQMGFVLQVCYIYLYIYIFCLVKRELKPSGRDSYARSPK